MICRWVEGTPSHQRGAGGLPGSLPRACSHSGSASPCQKPLCAGAALLLGGIGTRAHSTVPPCSTAHQPGPTVGAARPQPGRTSAGTAACPSCPIKMLLLKSNNTVALHMLGNTDAVYKGKNSGCPHPNPDFLSFLS